MIYEPTIVYECEECAHTETLTMEYVFTDYSGNNGYWTEEGTSSTDSHLEILEKDYQWVVNSREDNDDVILFCDDVCRLEHDNQKTRRS